MRTFTRVFAIALAAAFLGRGLPLRAQSQSTQSLGDVAKKEEERRKQVKKPAKVITNEDLQPGAAASTPPAPAPAAKDDAKADQKKDDAAKDEKDPTKDKDYWAGRMKQLQVALDRDTTYSEALQSRINALSTDFVNRDDPVQRGQISNDRQKAVGELNRLKAQIVADKKAISDLEEEARRAGVPPGWLR